MLITSTSLPLFMQYVRSLVEAVMCILEITMCGHKYLGVDLCYVPTPHKEPPVLDVQGGYNPLDWCDMEAGQLNYEDEGITQECMDFIEGYQSKSDDEYFTDLELEPDHVRIAKLVKGQPFKRMVDGVIRFNISQIFNSKEHVREIFNEYAIQEEIEFKRVKKDKLRQTYKCRVDGYEHASCMIDGVTFILKILSDQHDCHRVYNNKDAKVKWIASKFEKLVKSNPCIDVKMIDDLLRESYKVSVDIRYRAKNKALKELAKDHAKCFGYLRRYAYILNQSNPGVAVHIYTQDPQPIFQRMFVSFEPQKVYFLKDCRPFIGVDGCHLKGLFGGVLLSVVSLDVNSELFLLVVCICENETQDSWEWLINNLKIYLNYPEGRNLTFMSDR
ncbi:hypothetical protein Ddye_011375 [Dipteronia dyeriana]|uniref:MULE transposase domain-containing protein n=1 Tax=Dipteronia dyeriana TaxID=168575 RepID=A0AAE0CGU3_9ROSI|nr:hypothetical protein Ddye_011375 [Dipteronia dyeriana]